MGISNQAARVEKMTASMIQAWTKDLQAWDPEMWIGGENLTPSQILDRLKGIRDLHQQVRTCKQQFRAAVRARNSALRKNIAFQADVATMVRLKWEPNIARMKSYGVAPIKRRGKLSVEKQAIAKAREKETREVRGTKGKRQRLAITTRPKPTVVIRGLGTKAGRSGDGDKE